MLRLVFSRSVIIIMGTGIFRSVMIRYLYSGYFELNILRQFKTYYTTSWWSLLLKLPQDVRQHQLVS